MKHTTKKWLAVAGGLALCAVLVVLIAGRFAEEPPQEAPLPSNSTQPGDVIVQNPEVGGTPESQTPEKEDDLVVVKPEVPATTPAPDGGGAVSSGTEQTIQADPVKPTPSEEELKDPTQKPDGTPVEGTPTPEDHNNVAPPETPPKDNDGPQGGDTNSKGQTYLPGFGWIDNSGENQAIQAEDMYENGNKIGIMD